MSLIQFFRILWARRIIVIAALLSCVLAGILMIQILPKRYAAHARVMLDVVKPDPVTGQVIGAQFIRAYTRTQIELIRDYQTAEKVVDQLGWASNPDIIARFAKESPGDTDIRRWLAKQIIDNTDAEIIEASNIMEITFRSVSPASAGRIVTLIRDAYIENSLADRRDNAGETADWFRDQVRQAELLVKAAEEDRARFAKANGVVLQADNTDLESSRLRAISGQTAIEVIQPGAPAAAGQPVSPTEAQLDIVRQQLEQASSRLGPKHPAYQALERQLKALEQTVARERRAVPSAAPNPGSSRAELDAAYERQKQRVTRQSDVIDAINRMTRDIETKREELEEISKRASDLRLQANVGETEVRPLGEAISPESPESPKVPLILAGSVAFGGALGVLLSLLVEFLGRRIRGQEDLENAAGAPVLAEIGHRRKKETTLARRIIRYLSNRAQRGRHVAVGAE